MQNLSSSILSMTQRKTPCLTAGQMSPGTPLETVRSSFGGRGRGRILLMSVGRLKGPAAISRHALPSIHRRSWLVIHSHVHSPPYAGMHGLQRSFARWCGLPRGQGHPGAARMLWLMRNMIMKTLHIPKVASATSQSTVEIRKNTHHTNRYALHRCSHKHPSRNSMPTQYRISPNPMMTFHTTQQPDLTAAPPSIPLSTLIPPQARSPQLHEPPRPNPIARPQQRRRIHIQRRVHLGIPQQPVADRPHRLHDAVRGRPRILEQVEADLARLERDVGVHNRREEADLRRRVRVRRREADREEPAAVCGMVEKRVLALCYRGWGTAQGNHVSM